MKIAYDPAKNSANIEKHGLDFEDVVDLHWSTALFKIDNRRDYGEVRIQALVNDQQGIPYRVVFTMRDDGTTTWIISFHRAREKERKHYEKT